MRDRLLSWVSVVARYPEGGIMVSGPHTGVLQGVFIETLLPVEILGRVDSIGSSASVVYHFTMSISLPDLVASLRHLGSACCQLPSHLSYLFR